MKEGGMGWCVAGEGVEGGDGCMAIGVAIVSEGCFTAFYINMWLGSHLVHKNVEEEGEGILCQFTSAVNRM